MHPRIYCHPWYRNKDRISWTRTTARFPQFPGYTPSLAPFSARFLQADFNFLFSTSLKEPSPSPAAFPLPLPLPLPCLPLPSHLLALSPSYPDPSPSFYLSALCPLCSFAELLARLLSPTLCTPSLFTDRKHAQMGCGGETHRKAQGLQHRHRLAPAAAGLRGVHHGHKQVLHHHSWSPRNLPRAVPPGPFPPRAEVDRVHVRRNLPQRPARPAPRRLGRLILRRCRRCCRRLARAACLVVPVQERCRLPDTGGE